MSERDARRDPAGGRDTGARARAKPRQRGEGPWFRCYPDSALGDLAGLSSEQRNIAFTLALMQASRRGPVRLMPKTLAAACSVTTRPFNRVLGELEACGLVAVDGEWITVSMRGFGADSGQTSRNFAPSSGEVSAKFGPLSADFPNDSSRVRARQQPESRIESLAAAAAGSTRSEGGGEDRRAQILAAEALHRRVCEALGLPGSYRDELGIVVGWLEAGLEAHVMPAVERVARRKRGQAPLSLAYFTPAIEEEAGKLRAPPPAEAAPIAKAREPEGPPAWLAMRAALQAALGEAVFASWFAPLAWVDGGEDPPRIVARSAFVARWILDNHSDALARAAQAAGLAAVALLAPGGRARVIRTDVNNEGRVGMSDASPRAPPARRDG